MPFLTRVVQPSVLSQPTEAAVPLLRPPSVLSQLQQFMGKKFVFDDEDNPHEVYEMTEAAIPTLP
jgi:hypothetical protein